MDRTFVSCHCRLMCSFMATAANPGHVREVRRASNESVLSIIDDLYLYYLGRWKDPVSSLGFVGEASSKACSMRQLVQCVYGFVQNIDLNKEDFSTRPYLRAIY